MNFVALLCTASRHIISVRGEDAIRENSIETENEHVIDREHF